VSILTTKGDLLYDSAAGTAARLAIGSTNQALQVVSGAPAWKYPPGYEFDYVQITSPVTVTATTDGNNQGTAVIDGNAVTYDGSTRIKIEFSAPYMAATGGGANNYLLNVYDGTTDLGRIYNLELSWGSGTQEASPIYGALFLTPTNAAHTYHIRGWKSVGGGSPTMSVGAGAGGASAYVPAWYRITRA
jgi:hypothetical protein